MLVFKSKRSEMEYVVQKDGSDGQNIGNSDAVVRLRGLPFVCTHEDITNFFKGRSCYLLFCTILCNLVVLCCY